MPLPASKAPGGVRLVLAASALTLACLLVLRLVFFLTFRGTAGALDDGPLLHAASLGARFDLRLVLLVGLPVLALSWPRALDPSLSPRWRRVWFAYFVVAWLAVAFVYFVDFAHYDYEKVRVDATAFEHLLAPEIALEMVWESYPVVPLLLGLAAVTALYSFALSRLLRVALRQPRADVRRRKNVATVALALLVATLGIYGKLSWYPLRWSEAYFSQDPLVTALGLNPVLQVFDTWENRANSYDVEAVRQHYDAVASYLGVDAPDPETLTFARDVPAKPAEGRRPNIVIVICESFSAFKVGALGNLIDPTPRFDELARDGTLFTRFCVPSGATARSVFTALTSVPDVNLAGTATRNPLAVRQRTIVEQFDGYEKMYFIGGSANWGNLRGVLKYNIPDLRLYEEGDYESPRNDVWGISDLDLFRETNAVLRKQRDEPFLAFVQTSGNHRPWTIPNDDGGFPEIEPIAEQDLLDGGFDDLMPEYLAIRFLDHTLGEFIELAKREDYFDDTIFFFFGDHGTSFPSKNPPLPGVTDKHVPLLIYAPHLLPEPRVDDRIASSVDVVPTAAGLAGIAYRNETLGRDLFATDRQPYAFLRLRNRCGLLGEEFLMEFAPGGKSHLYRYRSEDPREDVAAAHPDELERMGELATGLLETARYMLFRDNRP